MADSKSRRWRHSVGDYGCTVTVYEDANSREIGGKKIIYAEAWNPVTRKIISRSLGRMDRADAIKYAADESKKVKEGNDGRALGVTKPILSHVFDLYLKHQTPRKSESGQQADKTRVTLFKTFLTPSKDLSKLTPREWQDVADARLSGAISAAGTVVVPKDRSPVKAGTVASDLGWLRGVCRWAKGWRDEHGRRLMTEDPTEGLAVPTDQNVSRPVTTTARYRKLREHSDQVMMEVVQDKKKVKIRTPLSELIDLAFHTGRRISAIVGLRYADLHLTAGPYGAITWRADTDKLGKAWTAPINEVAREAIDRVLAERPRPDIGEAYLFPLARDPERPITKDLANDWLSACEKLAGLPHLKQGGFHAFRRSWATARKHLPVQDVMAVGGWTDPSCLTTIYQQPDVDTMLRVATEAAEVREVSHG